MLSLVAGAKGAPIHANDHLLFASRTRGGAGLPARDPGGTGSGRDDGGREPRDDGNRPGGLFRTLFVGLVLVLLDRRLSRDLALWGRREVADLGEHHDRGVPGKRNACPRRENGLAGDVRDQLRDAAQGLGLVHGGSAAPDPGQTGLEATPERAALALFLESAGWPYDSERIAAALLDEFGSLRGLAGAPERRMRRVAGKGVSRVLAAHAELLRCGLIEEVVARPVLSNRDALFAYLTQEIGFAPEERLLALFVDARFGLIKSETMAVGSVSGTSADPFTLFQRGKELGAAGIVLAHNHPSMDTTPSEADKLVTARLSRIGYDLELPLLAHFIVAPSSITEIPIY